LPEQQSHDALHDIVARRQTSPSGLQPTGLRQTPRMPLADWLHVTLPEPGPGIPAEPQQSESTVQTSPTTWQPLAGWQTSTPVGPYGAQRRLQHAPPQAGTVPPVTTPPQTVPSTWLQLLAPPGGGPHVPYRLPATGVHTPVQQSPLLPHVSPTCWQNDGVVQMPLAGQNIEQHCEACVHGFPTVVQPDGGGVHVPFDPHAPLQHCALVVQA
jgi:hypothetical protein